MRDYKYMTQNIEGAIAAARQNGWEVKALKADSSGRVFTLCFAPCSGDPWAVHEYGHYSRTLQTGDYFSDAERAEQRWLERAGRAY